MTFSSVIDHFNTGTYTITRYSTPVYVQGRLTAGTTTSFSIVAAIQPLTGMNMSLLPEGSRNDNTKVLFTSTELQTAGDAEPDSLTIKSIEYVVASVEQFDGFGETYYRTLIRKKS